MICLILFWTFFKIGLFTIGGGYAMIPLIRQAVIEEHQWIDETQFTDFVGIAESTPGPFAINISTFCGLQVAKLEEVNPLLASTCSTLGVITPSILIILLIAASFKLLLRHWSVRAALQGARPAVIGLLGAAAFFLAGNTLRFTEGTLDITALILGILCYGFAQWRNASALLLILFGALLGLLTHALGLL